MPDSTRWPPNEVRGCMLRAGPAPHAKENARSISRFKTVTGEWKPWVMDLRSKDRNTFIYTHALTAAEKAHLSKASRKHKQRRYQARAIGMHPCAAARRRPQQACIHSNLIRTPMLSYVGRVGATSTQMCVNRCCGLRPAHGAWAVA